MSGLSVRVRAVRGVRAVGVHFSSAAGFQLRGCDGGQGGDREGEGGGQGLVLGGGRDDGKGGGQE